jgi:hypothetical protein
VPIRSERTQHDKGSQAFNWQVVMLWEPAMSVWANFADYAKRWNASTPVSQKTVTALHKSLRLRD